MMDLLGINNSPGASARDSARGSSEFRRAREACHALQRQQTFTKRMMAKSQPDPLFFIVFSQILA
jgi:hypothetical protein